MHLFNHPPFRGVNAMLLWSAITLIAIMAPLAAHAVEVRASDGQFNDRVEVFWTKQDDAENYTIFRCTTEDLESCQNIGKREKTESRALSDFDAEALVVYGYRVTACSQVFYSTTVQMVCGAKSEYDSGYRAGVAAADDFGNSCNEATAIGQDSSTVGALEGAGDKDYFRIQVSVPGELIINTEGDTDTAGILKDSNCLDIVASSTGGAGSNFQISQNVQAGTYFVETSGVASATGGYQLNSRLVPNDDYGNSCDDARQINPNSQRDGKLEIGGDVDYFHIELVSSGTLKLNSLGGTNTYGTLKDASCSTIAENDNDGGDGNFQTSTQLAPGNYYLEIRGASPDTSGAYQVLSEFAADDDHGSTCEEATDLTIGGVLGGVLEKEQDQDFFRLNITQRGVLQLTTTGDTDTYGTLFNANCNAVNVDDDAGVDANFLIEQEVIPGTYFIATGGYAGISTGPYEITSSFVAATDTGGSCGSARNIGINTSVFDEFEIAGDQDYFQVVLDTAGSLTLWSSGARNTVGSLRNANCELIVADNEGGQSTDFSISTDLDAGTYYLQAQSLDNSTGLYAIVAEFVPMDDFGGTCNEAASIAPESLTDGLIGSAGDNDFFRIDLASDSVLFMQTLGTTDTYGVLRDSNCSFIRRDDDGGDDLNLRIATFLQAGVYYLQVTGYNQVATGPYQLLLSSVDDGYGVDLTLNSGLNDAWFNPETAGQGFFVTTFADTGLIFVSWFTHETFQPDSDVTSDFGDSGHRWYTALGNMYGNEAFLDIELTSGGRFNSDDAVTQQYGGDLYIRFDNCNAGQIFFDLPEQGLAGWIPVERAVGDNIGVCEILGYNDGGGSVVQKDSQTLAAQSTGLPNLLSGTRGEQAGTEAVPLTELNYGLNDAWYNPDWPGQGFFVTVFPQLKAVFVSWFTFDGTAPDAQTPFNVGAPGHRWMTAFGFFEGNEADLDIELTQNGLFNDSQLVSQSTAGSMSIRFDDCQNGKISYSLDQNGESGEIDVVRVLNDSANLFECEFPFIFTSPTE